MKAARTIGLLAVLTAWPLVAVAGGDDGETVPVFERGPRIIHVTRPDEANDSVEYRAALRADPADPADRDEIEVPRRRYEKAVASPPRRHAKPADHHLTGLPPRRRPFSASQPPALTGPRRAVLSVPPPGPGGLTPIYPTPQFEAKAAAAEKHLPDATASAETPPPGYSPPPLPAMPRAEPYRQ